MTSMQLRKLQAEIDRVLKRVEEGVKDFEEIWDKVKTATSANLKEKYEGDLKKEIKKLQRYRDQIKTWAASNEVKKKKPLQDARKLIETKMEKFKVLEKETKTKAYSKEGLSKTKKKKKALSGPKLITFEWIKTVEERLRDQLEGFEAKLEELKGAGKKVAKEHEQEIEDMQHWTERHNWHLDQLNTMRQRLENDDISNRKVLSIKDDIEYYVESNQEPEFKEDEDLYEPLDHVMPGDEEDIKEEEEEDEDEDEDGSMSPRKDDDKDDEDESAGSSIRGDDLDDSPDVDTDKVPPPSVPSRAASQPPPKTAPPAKQPARAPSVEAKIAPAPNTPATTAATAPAPAQAAPAPAAAPAPLPMSAIVAGTAAAAPAAASAAAATTAAAAAAAKRPDTLASILKKTQQEEQARRQPPAAKPGAPPAVSASPSPKFGAQPAPAPAGALTPAQTAPPTGKGPLPATGAAGAPPTSAAAAGARPPLLPYPSLTPLATGAVAVTVPAGPGASKQPLLQHSPKRTYAPLLPPPQSYAAQAQAGQAPGSAMTAGAAGTSSTQATGLSPATSQSTAAGGAGALLLNQQQQQQQPGQGQAGPAFPPLSGGGGYQPSASLLGGGAGAGSSAAANAQAGAAGARGAATRTSPRKQDAKSGAEKGPEGVSSGFPPGVASSPPPQGFMKSEVAYGAPMAAHMPPEYAHNLAMLEPSLRNLPSSMDTERTKHYQPRNPYTTPACFPSTPAPIFDDPAIYEKFDTDTLFFIFYFQQGTPQQYLAARELKKQSWRYHKTYLTWFQRHDDPKQTTDEYEQGTYIYFDYETGWCQRIKKDFTFHYRHLEDELQVGL